MYPPGTIRLASLALLLVPALATSLASVWAAAESPEPLLLDTAAGANQRSWPLAKQGIVVPKRSALIVGLNQQFKLKAGKTSAASQPPAGAQLHNSSGTGVHQQAAAPQLHESAAGSSSPLGAGLLGAAAASLPWPLGSRHAPGSERPASQQHRGQHQNHQQQPMVDRRQQQILAANPNLLNLPASQLSTRSDGGSAALAALGSEPWANLTSVKRQQQQATGQADQQQQLQQQQQQQQLYRGFSLIELEVTSESDRRYIQDLYGNLSAALNEQAQNPNALTVSPYVDVDFWSFKYALNDHIDIMVSPKSRSFILGQLSRAKIRHRIKIDDIQSRLDQQLANGGGSSATQSSSAAGASAFPQPAGGRMTSSSPLGKSSSSLSSPSEGLSGRGGQQRPSAADGIGAIAGRLDGSGAATGAAAAAGGSPLMGRSMNATLFFDNYQRLADINQYLESIVERNRDVAQVKVIGRSTQGRYLRVLKLGYDQRDVDGSTAPAGSLAGDEAARGRGQSPVALNNASYILESFFKRQESVPKLGSIWLDGGTHAREWISPSTVLYIAHRLSDNHNRCLKFFDALRTMVSSQVQANAAGDTAEVAAAAGQRTARNYPQQYLYGPPLPPTTNLEPDLISGINEINTSLLGGKPIQTMRPRTELEQTLELLAKEPQKVAAKHSCDLDLEQTLRRYTFYIMPVLNPDGYEYSHTHNRLWRKTRAPSNHPIYRHFCLGADPNRNYDARHGSTGSSTHPCSQTYAGTVPFTEPETRHQSNFVYANRIGMKMFISFHSYSQMILLPYSHSKQLAPDHKDLESVGQAGVKAIERTHGTVYRVGPSASILYIASGTASDWAYEKAGIKYSYTIELRDTGTYGFLLPRQQIIPTGEETFNGLLAMIGQMEKNDNLLTSKSMLAAAAAADLLLKANGGNGTTGGANERAHNLLQLDQLQQTLNKHRAKPPTTLENVLDGSETWAAADLGPSGVRDRVGPTVSQGGHQHNDVAGPEPLAGPDSPLGIRLDEEPIGDNDNEPDSGYAFEGEGDLMEPTRGNIVEAAKLAEARLSGRQDHSRRIAQATSLTASGRSSINSPLLTSRTLIADAPKRESSDRLGETV